MRFRIFTVAVGFSLLLLLISCNEDPTAPDPETGTIMIDAVPDSLAAPWALIGPDSYSASGYGDSTLNELATGEYEITWGPVTGWIFPNPDTQTAELGSTAPLNFNGIYTAIYLDPTDPDNLVSNFINAWELMDLQEYRDVILYNNQAATDGQQYETFNFYFAPPGPGDPYEEGVFYLFDEEVATAVSMFSGSPGEHSTGIESITLSLIKHPVWSDPQSEFDVEGDPYPAGTKRCIYTCDMEVTLKEQVEINGEWLTGFAIGSDLEFHVIPVGDPANPMYRLWKWRDLHIPDQLRSAYDFSWSFVKALY